MGRCLTEKAQQALRGPLACCTKGLRLRKQASRMLAVHLVLRHQMERGFVTRLLQHGPLLVAIGAAGAARSGA
jgi:hypothetical protein